MSSSKSKILVVNDHGPTHFAPFKFLGLEYCKDARILKENPESIALIVLTGGADVCPGLYGAGQHPSTHHNIERDIFESRVVEDAVYNGIPMAGICRGAQLLCAMAGGRLVQDITGHQSCKHLVTARYPDGAVRDIMVTGDHHQMQYPFDLTVDKYEVLAWTTEPRSKHYAWDDKKIIPANEAIETLRMEPDVVWYPELNALGAQFHPEWMRDDTDGVKYFQLLVEHYLVPLVESDEPDRTRKKAA